MKSSQLDVVARQETTDKATLLTSSRKSSWIGWSRLSQSVLAQTEFVGKHVPIGVSPKIGRGCQDFDARRLVWSRSSFLDPDPSKEVEDFVGTITPELLSRDRAFLVTVLR